MELPRLALERLLKIAGPVACGEAPDIRGIAGPAHRIGRAPRAVRIGRAPAVLEIIEAGLPHNGVPDAPKVDPDVTVLVPEQRRETDVACRPPAPPEVGIARGPQVPQARRRRVRRRTERKDVDEHAFVVAEPI